jgi:hypothetical protein
MNGDASLKQQRKVALDRWADTYTARFDQALTNAWPDLVDRLERCIAGLSWYELSFGPGEPFRQCIKRAVQDWVERHVQPLLAKASEDFRDCVLMDPEEMRTDASVSAEIEGMLGITDIMKVLMLPIGPTVAGAAVATAITTATTWLIFTTVVVSWPLLIGGLVVGGALALFGVYSLARLKSDLQGRFRQRLLPRIESAVLGGGVTHEGKHIPSLRDQLIRAVEEAAKAGRRHLDEKG